jgi:hypothetical protein
LNELRNGITTNPEEDGLPILNQEQSMSLKTLGGKRKRWRQNDSLFANGASLKILLSQIFKSVVKENDRTSGGILCSE